MLEDGGSGHIFDTSVLQSCCWTLRCNINASFLRSFELVGQTRRARLLAHSVRFSDMNATSWLGGDKHGAEARCSESHETGAWTHLMTTHHSEVELQRGRFFFPLGFRASILTLQQFWGELTLWGSWSPLTRPKQRKGGDVISAVGSQEVFYRLHVEPEYDNMSFVSAPLRYWCIIHSE